MTDATLKLTKQLIEQASVTPSDKFCQSILIERLKPLGFKIEPMPFKDQNGNVTNLWARRGNSSPLVVFAGHTDVVPTGDLNSWSSDPFIATERDGKLYGRGAADMKTSIAAFITGIEEFIKDHSEHEGSIGLLITSDEEGPATCGTVKVIETLQKRNEQIDYCIVGEPSSSNVLGDTIKNGRRGSINCQLNVLGTQGHIAYPQLADNPIHYCGDVINTLTGIEWDQGNDYFLPTSLQISNIDGGTGATNVIPGKVRITFNLRFSTEVNDTVIKQRVHDALNALNIDYETDWVTSGQPFLTPKGELVSAAQQAIQQVLGVDTILSTSGGTSDGRFIAPTGAQVIELGPVNESIHKIDEHVAIETPHQLSKVYQQLLNNLLIK